ncbi:hypothetical protein [Actinomyces glycerinitolerans]|nr:hypothetical protein [Actinomyces glycerinitolerans]
MAAATGLGAAVLGTAGGCIPVPGHTVDVGCTGVAGCPGTGWGGAGAA